MLVFVLVALLLVLAIGGVVAFKTGLFKLEKVEVEEASMEDLPEESEGDAEADERGEGEAEPNGEEEAFDLDDGLTLKEKMERGVAAVEGGQKDEDAESFGPYDRLSNFPSGRGFLVGCQKRLEQAKAEGDMFVAACFDFDRFRFINSLKGLSIGDYVLTKISQEIPGIFPEGSHCTRISADHFLVLFPLTDKELFEILASKLKELCERIRGDIGVKSGLRICVGFAATDNLERDYDIQTLAQKANIARHCIKVSRSETYKVFEDSMLSTFLYGESALEDYSDNQFGEEFNLYYAPQVDFGLAQIGASYVMARWVCEESSGRASTLSGKVTLPSNGTKILYHVCKAISRWKKAGKHVMPVYVPLSEVDFYKEDLDEFLAKCLSEFQLEPSVLTVLVSASTIRMDWSCASRQMKKLNDMGVGIGVDDVDIGYKTLEFLDGLPLKLIVLHQSFAAKVHRDPERLERAKRMVEAARGLNLRAVFHGVDSRDQADALKEIGARGVLGVFCGKPLPAEDYVAVMNDYVEKRTSKDTVILDDDTLFKGDYHLF